ncbi:hypothetical protein ACFWWM_09960 [Streptomyces sp. NPDC058682]|uniref:hypothetical protein n=1 Tax=Streptomyces sp. NPDC058682 TaxID=3346596 RepID=UPI00364FEAAE
MDDDYKAVQPLHLEVDVLSLSHLGWRIDEIEACLVTTTYTEWEHHQEIELSGIARFIGEGWSDRFGGVTTRPPSCSPSAARTRPYRPSTSGL